MTDGAVKRTAIPTQRQPEPAGVDTGTPEAPVTLQNRSERARLARGGRGEVDAKPGKYERATRAPGDMHEPPPYPASRLHFEEEDHTG